MFQERYNVFGVEVRCVVTQCASTFPRESSLYTHVRRIALARDWRYIRVDTQDQIGFPDILLMRKREFWLIEGKMLKKRQLRSLEDDLQWQFGQLAFMNRALVSGVPYILAVAKGDCLAYISGVENDVACYPDFVELV